MDARRRRFQRAGWRLPKPVWAHRVRPPRCKGRFPLCPPPNQEKDFIEENCRSQITARRHWLIPVLEKIHTVVRGPGGTVARELTHDASWRSCARNCDDSRPWIRELTADTPADHRDGRGVMRTMVHPTLTSHMGIWRIHGEEDRGVLRRHVEHAPDRNKRLPHVPVSSRERGLAARGHPQGGREDVQRPRL